MACHAAERALPVDQDWCVFGASSLPPGGGSRMLPLVQPLPEALPFAATPACCPIVCSDQHAGAYIAGHLDAQPPAGPQESVSLSLAPKQCHGLSTHAAIAALRRLHQAAGPRCPLQAGLF